jgi:hypothetical protein
VCGNADLTWVIVSSGYALMSSTKPWRASSLRPANAKADARKLARTGGQSPRSGQLRNVQNRCLEQRKVERIVGPEAPCELKALDRISRPPKVDVEHTAAVASPDTTVVQREGPVALDGGCPKILYECVGGAQQRLDDRFIGFEPCSAQSQLASRLLVGGGTGPE